MRRIAQRAVPCQTTRQKQTKWVILTEKRFNKPLQTGAACLLGKSMADTLANDIIVRENQMRSDRSGLA
jgi:hypothetical protein|tara:strand:+ start:2519 stop:2725 length:207 start_codon:yes stop_codon:yes gene_type:complete